MTVKLKSVLPQAHLKGEQFIVNIFCYILKIITILFGSFLLLICNVCRPEPDFFYDSEPGLMVIEMVKGTIIPKIPTTKADLVALCKELDLNSEGTVKLLKSRLNQKLKPTSKLDPI